MTYHELAILWVDALAECDKTEYLGILYKEAQNAMANLYLEKSNELKGETNAKA